MEKRTDTERSIDSRIAREVMHLDTVDPAAYTGTESEAWKVVKAIHARGYYVSISYTRGEETVSVMFYKEGLVRDMTSHPIMAVSKTMPMAVCLAALKVIEREL